MPPIALTAIVAIALGGRVWSGPRSAPLVSEPVVATERGPVASAPAATPSLRADWPAAMSGEAAPTPRRLPREAGTDGLMGRLPFGLPDDETLEAAPWSRRLHGFSNFRTDPYQR